MRIFSVNVGRLPMMSRPVQQDAPAWWRCLCAGRAVLPKPEGCGSWP